MAADQNETSRETWLEFLLLTNRLRATVFDLLGLLSAEFDLDRAHTIALMWLSLGPSNVSDIATAMGLRQNRATVVVDRLSERGLVERTRRLDDRRFVTVRLTEAGRSVASALTLSAREQLAAFLLPLSASELDQFVTSLRRLTAPPA